MERAAVFAVLLVVVAFFAAVRGGAPERWAALFYVLAYVVSGVFALRSGDAYRTVEWAIFVTDITLAISLTILAMHANRYWTMWAASFQVIGIAAHFVKMVVPEILEPAYALTLVIWSYASIPLLWVATIRHLKRISLFGGDPSWSSN